MFDRLSLVSSVFAVSLWNVHSEKVISSASSCWLLAAMLSRSVLLSLELVAEEKEEELLALWVRGALRAGDGFVVDEEAAVESDVDELRELVPPLLPLLELLLLVSAV